MDVRGEKKDVSSRISVLRERRSATSFTDQAPPKDTLVEVIDYAVQAPSAGNRQGWRFVIVNDKAIIKTLVGMGGSRTIGRAPCGILVTYEDLKVTPEYHDDIQSAAACIQNLLLAAQAYGLGACWVSTLPSRSFLRRLFRIPWYYSPIAYVAIGYPDPTARRDVPRKNVLDDIVAENSFPMSGLTARHRGSVYASRVLDWVYTKLPPSIKTRLGKRTE